MIHSSLPNMWCDISNSKYERVWYHGGPKLYILLSRIQTYNVALVKSFHIMIGTSAMQNRNLQRQMAIMMTSSNGNIYALLALCAGNSPVPVNSPHKGQSRGALMFSFICVWINDWVNNREAGDLRRHRGHYDVRVMSRGNFLFSWATMCCHLIEITQVFGCKEKINSIMSKGTTMPTWIW